MLKLGELFFKFRDYSPIPFVVVMIIYGNPVKESILIGTIMLVVGELVRLNGVAHIGAVSRTRSHSTGQKLIVTGPFSRVRNPLYIGNFFMSTGLVILSNVHPYFTLFFVFMFFVQYIPIVLWEEHNLKKVFPDTYHEYFQNVPRWIPALRKSGLSTEKIKGDYHSALLSEKQTLLAAIIVFAVLVWKAELVHYFSKLV